MSAAPVMRRQTLRICILRSFGLGQTGAGGQELRSTPIQFSTTQCGSPTDAGRNFGSAFDDAWCYRANRAALVMSQHLESSPSTEKNMIKTAGKFVRFSTL